MTARPGEVAAPAGRGANILIIDDSVVARTVMSRMIATRPNFSVAGAVSDVAAALALLKTIRVDAILLDIQMPGIDGLTALPALIRAGRGAKVLMVSSSCDDGGAAAIRALALGAADTLVKPGIGAFAGRFSEVLADKLVRLLEIDPLVAPSAPPGTAAGPFDIVAIGASTGGIHALGLLLREIPAGFRIPILITQHLPESFMPYFAAQVAVLAGRPCDIATDRLRIRPGRVVVAPGDGHMRLVALGEGAAAIRVSRDTVRSGCMPSVDPMFDSLADIYGPRALAVVLSGMGRDGSDGAARVVAAGGSVVVQDRNSSVVWGMPGAIASEGNACAIMPPDAIGRLIAARRRPA